MIKNLDEISNKFNILADEISRLHTRICQIEEKIKQQTEFNKDVIKALEISLDIMKNEK